MKKILLAVISISAFIVTNAQNKDDKKVTDWSKIDLSNRANDHFMIQYGLSDWANAPDSAKPSGFSRHFNFYFMYDKPFKSNPHYSAGIGVGLGGSSMFFENTKIDLKYTGTSLPFTNVGAADHFKKYKLTTMFLEAPLELRYAANPVTPDKGFKAAIGLKAGTLLKAYTKGKNLVNATGTTLYGDKYIAKEQDKRLINSTRFAATGRFGYGNISLDVSYQINGFLKQNAGAVFHPYSIGLTLSGL
ncbi:MAG TPA: outer membrane beta-barrel protein [Panacibacter sp.]|nr:outer membrane beta-barrel protein [Panacibacter sp.]